MNRPPTLVDTHVHLDAVAEADPGVALTERWQQARAVGVRWAISMGVEPSSWDPLVARVAPLQGVRHALGIHPQAVGALSEQERAAALDRLPERLLATSAVAVGECGLDGPSPDPEGQARVFHAHLRIARELGLPLAIHVFQAHGPALEILRSYAPLQGVVHSFSGSVEVLRTYLGFGLHVSFAGAISRPNARRPIMAARAAPLDRLLLETDAPYQAPSGGAPEAEPNPTADPARRGQPRDLGRLLAILADLRGEDPAMIAERTTDNAQRLFRLGETTSSGAAQGRV